MTEKASVPSAMVALPVEVLGVTLADVGDCIREAAE